jgi:hypothetical protein
VNVNRLAVGQFFKGAGSYPMAMSKCLVDRALEIPRAS